MFGTETSIFIILNGIYFFLLSKLFLHCNSLKISSYVLISIGNISLTKFLSNFSLNFENFKSFVIFSTGIFLILNGFVNLGIIMQLIGSCIIIKNRLNFKKWLRETPIKLIKWTSSFIFNFL